MSILISAIVCTYNRSELFSIAMESLCMQTLDKSLYEIIIVDNNSTDNTREVSKRYLHFSNVHYYMERMQGISHARNCGWKNAKGDYLAYIDDECKVPEGWLTIAKDIIENFSPAAFGGPIYPLYNSPCPHWYRYGSWRPIKVKGYLKENESGKIFGGNSFFKRNLVEEIGGFDADLGHVGRKLGYCEETSLLKKIHNKMPEQLYYDPDLYLYHLVRPEKMKWTFIIREAFTAGRYLYKSDEDEAKKYYNSNMLTKMMIKLFMVIAKDIVNSTVCRNRKQYPYVQNYIFENTVSKIRKLGRYYEQYRNIFLIS